MAGWLAGCLLAGWLAGWLWLVEWLAGWLAGRRAGSGWLAGWLAALPAGGLTGYPAGPLVRRSAGGLAGNFAFVWDRGALGQRRFFCWSMLARVARVPVTGSLMRAETISYQSHCPVCTALIYIYIIIIL